VLEDRVVACTAQSVKTGEAVFWPFSEHDNKGEDGLKKIYRRADKEVPIGGMLDSSEISDLPHVKHHLDCQEKLHAQSLTDDQVPVSEVLHVKALFKCAHKYNLNQDVRNERPSVEHYIRHGITIYQ
jgi:hypothetical protein